MSFDQKKFIQAMPASFSDVFDVLKSFGFTPILIGGVVRDFLLTGKVGHDWDMELTHNTITFSKDTWKDLGVALTKLGKVTFLSYEIIRLDIKDVQYEFSPPRIENFESDWQSAGHSNFQADFDLKLPFEKAVERRDFTINAMGLRFISPKEVEFLDPLNGLVHLRDKILHPAGSHFEKDPVRFLRAIRFSKKLGFSFSSELETILERMPVSGISANYLWSETQKSAAQVTFLKTLIHWKEKKPELKLPLNAEDLSSRWEELQKVLLDPSKHETWIIALEWVGVKCESWQKYFSVSSETCLRLGRWAQSSKEFIAIKPEIFQGEFEEVMVKPEFLRLFDWYFTTKQLLQKNPDLPLLKMIEQYLPEWIHLYRFEVVKDVKHIDPPLRAKYQVWNLCQRI